MSVCGVKYVPFPITTVVWNDGRHGAAGYPLPLMLRLRDLEVFSKAPDISAYQRQPIRELQLRDCSTRYK
jgi:hypothetical protein